MSHLADVSRIGIQCRGLGNWVFLVQNIGFCQLKIDEGSESTRQLEENSSAGSRNVSLGFQELVETSVVRLEAGRQNVEEILVRRKLS